MEVPLVRWPSIGCSVRCLDHFGDIALKADAPSWSSTSRPPRPSVPQQSVLRQCALDTDGHRGEEEKSGEAPSGHEEKTAPVRASLQHAFAMHWPHERVCDGKREIEMGDPAF
jgi:hypothetical protein